jgi:hypothetical protein
MKRSALLASLVVLAPTAAAHAQAPKDNFIIKVTSKAPDAIVAAMKSYSEQKKWLYLGDSKIKQGEITLVKICIPEIGQRLWPVGLHLSAMLPCGNIGIYRKGTDTEISMLHPRYMQLLAPHPATEAAGAAALSLFGDMLDAATK